MESFYKLRPGLYDVLFIYFLFGLFSCRIAFLNLAPKNLRRMSVYTKFRKQPSNSILLKSNSITSTIFVVFFAYLPSNRSTLSVLKSSYYESEVWEHFVLDYDVYNMKQNGTDCTGSTFVPTADMEQSCTGLMEQCVSDSCRAV